MFFFLLCVLYTADWKLFHCFFHGYFVRTVWLYIARSLSLSLSPDPTFKTFCYQSQLLLNGWLTFSDDFAHFSPFSPSITRPTWCRAEERKLTIRCMIFPFRIVRLIASEVHFLLLSPRSKNNFIIRVCRPPILVVVLRLGDLFFHRMEIPTALWMKRIERIKRSPSAEAKVISGECLITSSDWCVHDDDATSHTDDAASLITRSLTHNVDSTFPRSLTKSSYLLYIRARFFFLLVEHSHSSALLYVTPVRINESEEENIRKQLLIFDCVLHRELYIKKNLNCSLLIPWKFISRSMLKVEVFFTYGIAFEFVFPFLQISSSSK